MPLRNVPIRRKLTTVILLTSGAVLLLTSAVFVGYEYLTFRQTTVRHLHTLGRIVAANSTAALAFDDHDAANEILGALRAEQNVLAAALYDSRGHIFAVYPEDLQRSALPGAVGTQGFEYQGSALAGFQPVLVGEERVGTLFLRLGTAELTRRIQIYALIALMVVGISLIMAYLISRALQQQISKPILNLANSARAVSERRDYSVRAHKQGEDEIGILTDAFNHMLTRIEEQIARLDLLNRITHAISERQHLESIFQVVLNSLEDHLPIDFGVVFLYDGEVASIRLSSVGRRSRSIANRIDLEDDALGKVEELEDLVKERLTYISDTAQGDSVFHRKMATAGLHSVVVAPLAVEDRVFGVLITARAAESAFSSAECEFLAQLSEHVALAAHQAQLHAALRTAYDELQKTQQASMQQERLRALGQMASGIAHDISNAISPVALYTEALLDGNEPLTERAREYLQTIQHAIDDVAATVARVREFYRQRGEQLVLAPVDLNRIISQVIDLTRARWSDMPQQRGTVIELEVEEADDLPVVVGIDTEIREALINLIFNAVDAMPSGGTLTIRTRVADGPAVEEEGAASQHVRLEVEDTGIGMSDDTRRRALEPFFTTKGDRGTGLGLAMVYGMAQRHRGSVDVESTRGEGSTVSLLFPVHGRPLAELPVVEPELAIPTRLRILVIDDDPLLLKSLHDTLASEGHMVRTASEGEAGLRLFQEAMDRSEPFAVVMTDLGMPHMDGRQVARSIGKISPSTPVIILTGWGQRLPSEPEAPNIARVLSKPPRLREIREALSKCCADVSS